MQNFRASFAKLNSTGIIPNSGFDRLNLTLSVNSKFGDKLTFNGKMMYSNEKAKNRPRISDSPGSSVQAVYRIPADHNVYDYKGDLNKLGAVPVGMVTPDKKSPGEELQVNGSHPWGQNPYWAAYQFVNSNKRDRIIASGQLRYDISDFLYAQFKGGMDWSLERATSLTPQGTGYERSGFINENEITRREINLEYIVGLNKDFGKLNVNTFFGGNQMRKNFEVFGLNGNNGFNVPFHEVINNAVSKTFNYYYESAMINSLFASAEIGYNNYLFLTATARQDWFSTLQKENNSILYPSAGASFVFSEAFAAMPQWLSFGKLRVAWAQVGDASSVRPFDTQLNYVLDFTHLTKPMAYFSSGTNIPNASLKPFRSEEVEFGIDVRFLENKIGFDLTYYSQVTTDDILKASVSNASGFFTSSVNLGKLTNKGVEIAVTATPVSGTVTWNASLNFAVNNSNVVSLMPGQSELFVEEPRTRTVAIKHIVGHPYGMITGLKQQQDSTGRLVFNNFGAPVATNKYEILGNGVPKFTGGVNNSISYKQFNLSFLVDFKWGGQIYSGTNSRMTLWGFHKQTLSGRAEEAPLVIDGVQQIGNDDNGTPDDTSDDKPIYEPVSRTLLPGEARN